MNNRELIEQVLTEYNQASSYITDATHAAQDLAADLEKANNYFIKNGINTDVDKKVVAACRAAMAGISQCRRELKQIVK